MKKGWGRKLEWWSPKGKSQPQISERWRGRTVAVVGTRRPSGQEGDWAALAGRQVAECAGVLVTGLAVGVDRIAADACLSAGGRVIACIPHGVEMPIYPLSSQGVASRIVEQGGEVVSMFCGCDPVSNPRFHARNRLIAEIAPGVLAIGVGKQSGTVSTLRAACDPPAFGRRSIAWVSAPNCDVSGIDTLRPFPLGVDTASILTLDDLCVWVQDAVDGVLSEEQSELI